MYTETENKRMKYFTNRSLIQMSIPTGAPNEFQYMKSMIYSDCLLSSNSS